MKLMPSEIVSRLVELWNDRSIARDVRRLERLTTRASTLRADQEHDLVELSRQKFVRVGATGHSITEVYASIQSLLLCDLRVIIRPGTCFVSQGAHQNMVTRTEQRLHLCGLLTQRLMLPVACINPERPIPGEPDRFFGVRRSSDALVRFLEMAIFADPMTVQAGVWAITASYSREEVQSRLWTRDWNDRQYPVISSQQIAEAKRMLNVLGISNLL